MKSGTSVVRWRPVAGVVFAGALAISVGAFAAPRSGGDTSDRGTKGQTRVQSEAAGLVSGNGEHLQSVIAGNGSGASVEMFPVPAVMGAYPGGANVVISEPVINRPAPKGPTPCNEIAMDFGGFRVWMEWKYDGWDPNLDQLLPGTGTCTASICTVGNTGAACVGNSDCDLITASVCQGQINAAGMLDADIDLDGEVSLDGDQDDLLFAYVSCPSANTAGNTFCSGVFGGSGNKCLASGPSGVVGCPFGFCCAPMFYNKSDPRTDSVCSDGAGGQVPCQADCDVGAPNMRCFAAAESPAVLDDFAGKRFGGYFIIDVPATAKGRYFIDLLKGGTFINDRHSPAADIPLSEESGACVYIRTGQCCFALGTPGAGCEDGLTGAECANDLLYPQPRIFTEGNTCLDECRACPDGVPQAEADAFCLEVPDDACTIDTCNQALGICNHALIAGFVPGTNCCNPADGDLDVRDDGDVCTGDICTLANDRGDASNPILPASTSCLDGNPCTTADHCDGINSQANGGCSGADVNLVACTGAPPVCPVVNEIDQSSFACSVDGFCFCTLTPDLDYVVTNSVKNPACDGGSNAGFFCTDDGDCPGGFCNEFAHGGNCFDTGEKIQVRVHIGAAGAPINGGEFLLQYDPSCVSLNTVSGVAPYVTTVYGPVSSAGSTFIAVGVDPFGGVNGPLGNADILALSFTKVGTCDECELCFGDNNPQHTYLVDSVGQRVDVAPNCKAVRERPDLSLDVPGSIDTNADCNVPTANEPWTPPSASSDCGPVTMTCRGAHESGVQYPQGVVLNGGVMYSGASSFCCVATEDLCGQSAGCGGTVNDCTVGQNGKPSGCWTVNVSDQTSLDIDVQLEPPITHNDADGELTRCIKFCLFEDLAQLPTCFSDDVTFGGLTNFIGKGGGKVKVPGDTQWSCITAQDQLHTLRSCYYFNTTGDCLDGVLHAQFIHDPGMGGNWLIGGNLDGWKKDDDDPTTNPSLDIIDILDWGTMVGQYGNQYVQNDTPCGTPGPNGDINGDGVVDEADYAFVMKNFLTSTKTCCGGPQIGSEPVAITEITVDELRQMGLGELAAADLTGDGVLNTEDMDAFLQGARPTKGSNNRGGKGVRSGR